MRRKRKQPTPNFKLPPPFNPMTGEQHPLQVQGVYPYAAMMQVAAADTYDEYVVCRGFDVRIEKFIDNPPGISVAKPYGRRTQGTYRIGQIFPAILPLQTGNPSPTSVPWRVGQNPGVAADSDGHPASLTEEVGFLIDHNGEYIAWQLIDEPWELIGGCLAEAHPGRGTVFGIWLGDWNSSTHEWDYDTTPTSSIPAIDWRYGVPYPGQGSTGLFAPRASDTYGVIWEVVALDCEVPNDHSCGAGSLDASSSVSSSPSTSPS